MAALERDGTVSEHFTPPAAQCCDLGAVIGRDPFEVVDGCDHLGGNVMALGDHAQQHLEQLDGGLAIDGALRRFETRQRLRVTGTPAL